MLPEVAQRLHGDGRKCRIVRGEAMPYYTAQPGESATIRAQVAPGRWEDVPRRSEANKCKAECLDYESKVEDAEAATEMLHNGDTLREALIRANRTRPWWDIKLTPEEKDLLGKITTGTCISVPSWQCSEKPCYKVTRIDPEGFVYLWGEDDRWQRPYGNWVVIGDLLRYARQTFAMNTLR